MDRSRRKDSDRPPRRGDDHRESRTAGTERRRSRSPQTHDQRDQRRSDRSDRWSDQQRQRSHRDDRPTTIDGPRPPTGPRGRGSAAPSAKNTASNRRDGGTQSKASSAIEIDSKTGLKLPQTGELSEEDMKRIMGFTTFRSTKETKVPGNHLNYGVYRAKTSEYRQYMNRVGGFNRPLSPGRD